MQGWNNLSSGAKAAMGIFAALIVIVLAVIYVKTFAAKDMNEWLCGVQKEMDVPVHMHFRGFGEGAGATFDCPVNH